MSTEALLSPALAVGAGYLVSLGGGWLVVPRFYDWTVRLVMGPLKLEVSDELKSSISSHVTGLVERFVFSTLVIVQVDDVATAMAGWIALKMAATWGKKPWRGVPEEIWDRHAFLALQAGLVSMLFAGAGGALALCLM